MYDKVFKTWDKKIIKWKLHHEIKPIIAQLTPDTYPPKNKIFRVFREVDYNLLKVVLVFLQ